MISFFLKIRNRKPWSLNIELKSGIFSIHFRIAIALSARITQNRLSTTRKSPRSTSAGWRRRTAAATTKVRRKVQERREKRMTTKMAGRANPAKRAKRSKIISRSDFKSILIEIITLQSLIFDIFIIYATAVYWKSLF